ncbi:MAG: hypothetical protein MUC79_11300 [Thiobacillaceae bacterium]|nr:hypothetical protein [Thiobacillaceae bacterium]
MNRRLAHWLAWLAARAGWPGLLGLLLLAAGLFTQASLLPDLARATSALEDEARRLAARQQAAPLAPEQPPLAQRLQGADRAPEAVARLFAAAGKAGLELYEGTYKLQGDPAAGLLRYQITLPVEGDYPALRRFLAEALNSDANLALDGLTLTRETVEETQLRAVLRFTLYLSRGRAG